MGGESWAEQSQVALATPKYLCKAWAGLSSLVGGEYSVLLAEVSETQLVSWLSFGF